jgi:O-antigen/teichoic acid export membrane protein
LISKKFIRDSLIYTIAGALPMASSILLLFFYIPYLSTATLGELAVYMPYSMLIQIFVTYSFDTSIYIYFHDFKADKDKLARFVSSVFIFILIVGLVTALVMTLLGGFIFERFYLESKIVFFPYGFIAVLTGVLQSLFKVNSSLLQTQEKASSFLWMNLLSFSMIATFTIIGLQLFPDTPVGPMGGRLLASVISGVWVLVSVFRQFGVSYDFSLVKSTFGFNHPSLIYQIMQWINTQFDKTVMVFYLPLAQVGIYDFASKCLTAIEFVIIGFYNSFFPKVLGIAALQTHKRTTVEINRYYNGLTAVTILLVGLSIFFFQPLMNLLVAWFHKPNYLAVIRWIPFIGITYLLRSMRFYVAMPYAVLKYSKPLPFFYLAIVVVKIASMIVLIPLYGIQGVIISTWIGYGVEVLILYFGVKNKFTIEFNVFKLVVAPLAMAGLVMTLEPWLGATMPYLVHGLYIVFAVLLLAWAYRHEINVFQLSKIIK